MHKLENITHDIKLQARNLCSVYLDSTAYIRKWKHKISYMERKNQYVFYVYPYNI